MDNSLGMSLGDEILLCLLCGFNVTNLLPEKMRNTQRMTDTHCANLFGEREGGKKERERERERDILNTKVDFRNA